MKKIYILSVLFSLVAFSGCSKDFLKKYDKRIVGTWRISNVRNFGIGGDSDDLPFKEGTFTFMDGGSLTYVSAANVTYQGSWDIVKKYRDDETTHVLQITAVNFTTQQILTEYYDDMNFAGTDHFKANINYLLHTYVTHFRR